MNICRRLTERIKEIYEEKYCEIEIAGRKIGKLKTDKGVRQGCPLSLALFNTCMAYLETEMKKAQEGGIRVGKTKISMLSYADDIVILANNKVGMREALKRFSRYHGSEYKVLT